MATLIKQGDSYRLPVKINTTDGDALNLNSVESVEFMLHRFRKVYPGDVDYMEEDEAFLVPLSQDETFSLKENTVIELDIRVKYANGDVRGIPAPLEINIANALSTEVL